MGGNNMDQQIENFACMNTSSELADSYEITIQRPVHDRVIVIIGNYGHRTWLSLSTDDAQTLANKLMSIK
jgi:putative SOS response-associated peptidase YedK